MRTGFSIVAVAITLTSGLYADTITILDSSDEYSFSHTGTSRLVTEQTPSACSLPETASNSCTLNVFGLGLFPVGTGSTTYYITEPDGSLSDTLQIAFNIFVNSYDLIFKSDSDGTSLGPIPPGATIIRETGQPQLVTTVTWNDSSTDQIFFVSDLEVPEPAGALLLAGGLLAMALLAKLIQKRNGVSVQG